MAEVRPVATPILFVHHGEDWIRGSERCLVDLVAHLDRSRFRPIVWCNAPAMADAARRVGAEVHHAPTMPAVDGAFPIDASMARTATALVRRYRVGLIHANDTGPLPALVVAARRQRVPVLAHIHLIPTAVERRWALLHQVTLAVGVSHASIDGLLADGMAPDRVTVVYNGVDTDRLARGSAAGLRAELGIPPTAVVAAVVASLIARKGVDVAIGTVAHARAQGRDVHLVICGDGVEEGSLRALAARLGVASATHFLGVRDDVGAVLRDATDVLVSGARLEAFPLNLLEAGACGLPVLVTDIAPHREAVVDGVTGVVVPLDDSAAMGAALVELADAPERRAALGAAARSRVLARFTLRRWIDDFEATYTGLIARPARDLGWLRGSTWPPAYATWLRDAVGRRIGRRRGIDRPAGAEADGAGATREC
jgi:glycosyltransferase involved in cell wall biosynthesis